METYVLHLAGRVETCLAKEYNAGAAVEPEPTDLESTTLTMRSLQKQHKSTFKIFETLPCDCSSVRTVIQAIPSDERPVLLYNFSFRDKLH